MSALRPSARRPARASRSAPLSAAASRAHGLPLVLLPLLAACGGGSSSSTPPAASACAVTPSAAWSSRVGVPDDPFTVQGTASTLPGWIKFSLLACDPSTVYFQDGHRYAFHYDFATQELDPLAGLSREEFERVSLNALGREVVLGAIVVPPAPHAPGHFREYGIQLVSRDPLPPEEVVALFDAVVASVDAAPDVEALYFPTYEQQASAREHEDFLAARGVRLGSAERWAESDVVYAEGWTVGRLVFVPADRIEGAFLDGTLRADDVLLTDGVPAEVPYVAGIVSLEPSSPNSHVAILATTFGVPFAYLALPEQKQHALALDGRRIALRARHDLGRDDVRLIDVEDELDATTVAELLALKEPAPLGYAPLAPLGAFGASVDGLGLGDVGTFGGKAANFGLLRRAIPEHSPVAAALSFDLWTAFLDQELEDGSTLRATIDARLAAHAFPPDVAALEADLEEVRELIEDPQRTAFAEPVRTAVLDLVGDPRFGFDPGARLRFRSSTNVEDSEHFVGAGLYESKSGCVADELDGDDDGPSLCDPDKAQERGVFRAIRKVFASFYGRNPFLERRRHGVLEDEVGMALLVHPSFPDEIELANGVATFERRPPGSARILIVTQLGANSVTNPSPGSVPEEVEAYVVGTVAPALSLRRPSNRVVLGETVLEWTSEYAELVGLLELVAQQFELESGKASYLLDFEFKKVAPEGRLVVKQVREVPREDGGRATTPFLVNEPTEYVTFQGEASDAAANHRLKLEWTLETESTWLTPEVLASGIYTRASLHYRDECGPHELDGELAGWPGAEHFVEDGVLVDVFRQPDLANPRTFRLRTHGVPTRVAPGASPIVVQSDFGFGVSGRGTRELRVDYAEPVLGFDPFRGPWVLSESVLLHPRPRAGTVAIPQERRIESPDGLSVTTRFAWPQPVFALAAGYTAPLLRFEETVVEGLTASPLVLADAASQTYRRGHHNFSEGFLFAPFADPGVSAEQRSELELLGVRWITATGTPFGTGTQITLYSGPELGVACDAGD